MAVSLECPQAPSIIYQPAATGPPKPARTVPGLQSAGFFRLCSTRSLPGEVGLQWDYWQASRQQGALRARPVSDRAECRSL